MPFVLQLYWYWVPSQLYVVSPSGASVTSVDSAVTVESQARSRVLRLNVGSGVCCTDWPAAFVMMNFAGTVLPSLNRLCVSPVWCAVSLIGWRKPFQPYSTL